MAVLSIAVTVGLVACDDDSSAVAPVMEGQVLLAAMEATIQDEFRAELIYQRVLDDFGPVLPFKNILKAEERHSEAIALLHVTRGLPVPESRWVSDQIPSFSSITAACQAGVVAEIENVEIYDRYFDLPFPEDVRTVFTNNRAASVERHLPAFERCS
jgi:hypothetical protein